MFSGRHKFQRSTSFSRKLSDLLEDKFESLQEDTSSETTEVEGLNNTGDNISMDLFDRKDSHETKDEDQTSGYYSDDLNHNQAKFRKLGVDNFAFVNESEADI